MYLHSCMEDKLMNILKPFDTAIVPLKHVSFDLDKNVVDRNTFLCY